MFFKKRLKTKEFLLHRNVPSDSNCALCDATWESELHLMIQCLFSKSVWMSILTKLNLTPFDCENPLQLMQSVLLLLNQGKNDIQTIGILVVNAFIWHIWAKRNGRIFRMNANTNISVTQKFLKTVCSRILYLGLQLPDRLLVTGTFQQMIRTKSLSLWK